TAYTINACAADEVLTMTNKRLNCVKSRNLAIAESDPTVQPFAKAALPNCAAGQVLTTAISGSTRVLRCAAAPTGGQIPCAYTGVRSADMLMSCGPDGGNGLSITCSGGVVTKVDGFRCY